ncbi:hypothetical protein [Armatimonas sp.]|uniref:hypothetical protein n=1 Tax=Armatimonas sp. TaxID=1872638 RepID=UPI0037502BCE
MPRLRKLLPALLLAFSFAGCQPETAPQLAGTRPSTPHPLPLPHRTYSNDTSRLRALIQTLETRKTPDSFSLALLYERLGDLDKARELLKANRGVFLFGTRLSPALLLPFPEPTLSAEDRQHLDQNTALLNSEFVGWLVLRGATKPTRDYLRKRLDFALERGPEGNREHFFQQALLCLFYLGEQEKALAGLKHLSPNDQVRILTAVLLHNNPHLRKKFAHPSLDTALQNAFSHMTLTNQSAPMAALNKVSVLTDKQLAQLTIQLAQQGYWTLTSNAAQYQTDSVCRQQSLANIAQKKIPVCLPLTQSFHRGKSVVQLDLGWLRSQPDKKLAIRILIWQLKEAKQLNIALAFQDIPSTILEMGHSELFEEDPTLSRFIPSLQTQCSIALRRNDDAQLSRLLLPTLDSVGGRLTHYELHNLSCFAVRTRNPVFAARIAPLLREKTKQVTPEMKGATAYLFARLDSKTPPVLAAEAALALTQAKCGDIAAGVKTLEQFPVNNQTLLEFLQAALHLPPSY